VWSVKRPTKKEIKAKIDHLQEKPEAPAQFEQQVGKISSSKNSQRIRKKGI
jgi:hypothetical protein